VHLFPNIHLVHTCGVEVALLLLALESYVLVLAYHFDMLKVVTNEKGEAVGDVLTIIC
jgi:hypothetical protein